MADNILSENIISQNSSENENENSEYYDDTLSQEEFDYSSDLEISHYEFDNARNMELQERITSLQSKMVYLKQQLAEERTMWKKEVEETAKLALVPESKSVETEETCNCAEESDSSSDLPFSVAEYEEKLAKYQAALAMSQAEKRANLRRQMAVNNYKRRLIEVENMCNLELLRVKQSVQFLQPLQMIASEWNINKNENMNNDDEIQGIHTKETSNENNSENFIMKEVIAPMESISSKLCNEMNEIYFKMQSCNIDIPTLTSTSEVWKTEKPPVIWNPSDCCMLPNDFSQNL